MRWREQLLWFAPAIVLLTLVTAYPALRTFAISFFDYGIDTSFEANYAGLSNYKRLAGDSRFQNSLSVTAWFTLISVTIEFAIGLCMALAVHTWTRGRGAARTILLLPWILPTALVAVLWAWIFNDQYGVLNAVLLRIGLIDSPVAWLATPTAALSSIIIADVWKTFPFIFLILLAGLQSIPKDLYEAMDMDGGGAWARFRHVSWPHLRPFVFVAVVFRTVQAFAYSFDLVYVLTGGGPGGATETVPVYFYQTTLRYLDFGYGAAIVTATVAVLAIIAFALRAILLHRYEGSV